MRGCLKLLAVLSTFLCFVMGVDFLRHNAFAVGFRNHIKIHNHKRGDSFNHYSAKGGFPEHIIYENKAILQQLFRDIIARDIEKYGRSGRRGGAGGMGGSQGPGMRGRGGLGRVRNSGNRQGHGSQVQVIIEGELESN
jgi:hypothetical protein